MQPMIDYVKLALRRWKDFQGRSRRAEFWWFTLAALLARIAASVLDGVLFGWHWAPLGVLLTLVLIVPSLAVMVRRLHDTDRSGWWALISLVPIVGVLVLVYFDVQPGTAGPNRFGPDPIAEPPPQAEPDAVIT